MQLDHCLHRAEKYTGATFDPLGNKEGPSTGGPAFAGRTDDQSRRVGFLGIKKSCDR
jgi:hypothetical protein